ncbi:MAG: histidinol-phosphatase HisJ family protein [Eubacterium sp.]|nr:histidinol-phosphatase HisJ family protein [Eubacterium sp.]
MNDNIIMDMHNHSNLSPDGSNTPEEMVQRACELGIKHYSLTDHLEINKFYDEEYLYEEPIRRGSEIIPALIEKYSGKINMGYGIELGQPLQDMPLTERMLSSYKYDFIIGSLHMCDGWDDFYLLDYSQVSADMLMGLYFEELLAMARWGEFDVLGHLTYPLRYITGESGIEIDMEKYLPIIKEIFTTLIKKDMGIEINTSGLRQQIGKPLPDEYYVALYKQLGGKILTIGSDAHRTEDLGKGIAECTAMAKRLGFDYLTFYKNRKPQFIKI